MTLVVAVTGPESIWLLADRQLSYPSGRPRDDGRKIMFLNTGDGVAILGYAGLGATAAGTEPADWMSAVLRGRNLPLEGSLTALASALERQFPRHMAHLRHAGVPEHHVIIPAFVGSEPRLYTISLVFSRDRTRYQFRWQRRVAQKTPTDSPRTPRLCIGGSGTRHVTQSRERMRSIVNLVRANDARRISPDAVADFLAGLNFEVHRKEDKSVGPRCIVAWRFRAGGVHKGGGGQQFYTRTDRDRDSPALPTIAEGNDLKARADVLTKYADNTLKALTAGDPAPEFDKDGANAALARLPDKPDEKLR